MQSAIEYAAIPTINLTPLFLVTNPLTNSSQSDTRIRRTFGGAKGGIFDQHILQY